MLLTSDLCIYASSRKSTAALLICDQRIRLGLEQGTRVSVLGV